MKNPVVQAVVTVLFVFFIIWLLIRVSIKQEARETPPPEVKKAIDCELNYNKCHDIKDAKGA